MAAGAGAGAGAAVGVGPAAHRVPPRVHATRTCPCPAVFHFAMPILSWVGERPMIHVVFGAFTLRFLWYGLLGTRLLPSPWAVLPAELLHGITFACAWTVGCLIAKRCAPPGLSSTFQGIFQCIYFGIGLGIGSILGGWIYFYGNGARTVFRATCGIMLACWAAFAVYKHGLARAWGLST